MDNKNFWYEALKAGTIVGLVSVAFSLATQPLAVGEHTTWLSVLNIVSWTVTIALLYGFTRRIASLSVAVSPEKGFTFGRGVGFVVATMLFVGVITGAYTTIMSNYFIKEEVLASVDELMVVYQDLMPDSMFDQTYSMARKAVLNPFYVTFSSILSSCFIGLLLSLVIASLTRKAPDIFASADDANNQNN